MEIYMTLALSVICLSVLIYSNEGRPRLSKDVHKVSDIKALLEISIHKEERNNERHTQEDGEPLTKFTKEDIDKKHVEVNSELETLLESMSCKGSKAVGIHPELKQDTKNLLTEEEHDEDDEDIEETKRNFIYPTEEKYDVVYQRRWKDANVPYVVDIDSFDKTYQSKLLRVLDETEEAYRRTTCVQLQRKTDEEIEKENITHYVLVFNDKTGVGSEPWKQPYQKLHLEQKKCLKTGTVTHEFGHTLGMKHEQSRLDRDETIWVDLQNVKEGKAHNFNKIHTMDTNPYDYHSIMQYSLKGFAAKTWKKTIHFLNPELEFLAGQRLELTFYDVMDITAAYNCTEDCDTDIECLNGGFVYHTCKCYCPEGLTGDHCEVILSEECGGVIDLVPGQPMTVTSPNYPDNYDVGKICYWLLRAPNSDHRVMIEFEDFDISSNDELGRCYHWLEVRYNLIAQPGPKYCCTRNMRNKISTTKFGNSHMMMLILDTATVSGAEPSRGFNITAHAVEPKACFDDPPSVPNAVIADNDLSVGDDPENGDVIKYVCEDEYQVVGERFVFCEADGTWSKPRFHCVKRDPIVECSFNNSDDCGMQQKKRPFQWVLREEDGNGFLTIEPKGESPTKRTYLRFSIKPTLEADKTYCLEFDFRRYNEDEECAAMYVANYDFKYYPWKYRECKKMDWTHFKGDYGPLKEDMDMQFIAKAYSGHYNFNMDIDNIKVREGSC